MPRRNKMSLFHYLWLFAILQISQICDSEVLSEESICSLSSCPAAHSGGQVEEWCDEKEGATMDSRCCLLSHNSSESPTIIGLDLRGCDLHSLSVIESKVQPDNSTLNRTLLLALDISNNSLHHCNDKEFKDLGGLELLALPGAACRRCPGGPAAWEHTDLANGTRTCHGEIDLCEVDSVSCPNNSSCVMQSPGNPGCVCDEGFYGYKCLRQGTFPVAETLLTVVAATLLLSVAGWLLFRRDAKLLKAE